MTVQCCPLSGGDGEGAAAASSRTVRKARKHHRCVECREDIKPGDRHEYLSGIWDGEPDAFRTCLSCVEIRTHFACEGYLVGSVWSDLEENFFPDMKAGGPCMEGLSPAAKERLFDLRTKWLMARGVK